MNKKIKEKLVDACFPIIANLNGQTDLSDDEYYEKILRNIIDECIRVYDLEMENPPYKEGVVFVSIPIDNMKAVKKSITSACAPRVTFNDDIEVMKEERDMSRQVSLDELQRWIDKVLQ